VSAKRGAMEIHKCQRITGITWELVVQLMIRDGLFTSPGLLSSSLFLKLASEAAIISNLISNIGWDWGDEVVEGSRMCGTGTKGSKK